ncbi:hypothetical protein FK514_27520, partial [Klebsiella pneumoniae]|nr:hypothetical protein [Klebsiella pneumoniae]
RSDLARASGPHKVCRSPVPLLVLCRWLWLGGIDNWLHADLWHSLRQTLLLGAGGALLTTVCAIPIAWLGVRYPRPLFRLLEGFVPADWHKKAVYIA